MGSSGTAQAGVQESVAAVSREQSVNHALSTRLEKMKQRFRGRIDPRPTAGTLAVTTALAARSLEALPQNDKITTPYLRRSSRSGTRGRAGSPCGSAGHSGTCSSPAAASCTRACSTAAQTRHLETKSAHIQPRMTGGSRLFITRHPNSAAKPSHHRAQKQGRGPVGVKGDGASLHRQPRRVRLPPFPTRHAQPPRQKPAPITANVPVSHASPWPSLSWSR